MTKKLHLFDSVAGAGVCTQEAIEPGATVVTLQGIWVDRPTRYTLQVEEDRHLLPEGQLWAMINHSCSPNLRVDTQQMRFVAVRTIAPAEELTFNYLSTEWAMAEPFQCQCASADCMGWIAGFGLLSVGHRERIVPLASEFIAQKRSSHPSRSEDETAAS